jgi:cyclopropane-fatty-acyl-phospholipid synthase
MVGKTAVAQALGPFFRVVLGDPPPLQIAFWDGTSVGPEASDAVVRINRPEALRRILYTPNEVGLARAYVSGDLDIEGDFDVALDALLEAHPDEFRLGPKDWVQGLSAAARVGVLGRPLPAPAEEARLRGSLHGRLRDGQAVSHHYDVSNDFYRLVLGPSLAYSCARFVSPDDTLEGAQEAKFDNICRKLGLTPGDRLLDVGCGWGSMAIHAARHYGVDAVGITLSREQSELARKRVAEAGLTGRVEIRLEDYRELRGDRFDAISSIGMFEHVGKQRRKQYFTTLAGVLNQRGRLLNHAISTPGGAAYDRRSFMARYVFPDGELQDLGETAGAMEQAGLEVRDVESLREHYPMTLRRWIENLLARWDEAVALVGEPRARVWRLYMTGAARGFDTNQISIHQVLGVKPGPDGASGSPLVRV